MASGSSRPAVAKPKARAAGGGAPAPSSSSSPQISSDSASESVEGSLSWSETSIWLEGSDFDHAVERLHSLYRQELQTRHVPGKSQAGCLAGLRRKTNKSSWGQVQAEARQRLTGQRLEEWQQYFAATHEKRRRRRPRRSRSRAQLHELSKPGTPFRPRSCRALNFQKPCHLHPYARPTFPKQCRKCQKQRQQPWSGCPAPEQGETIPRVIGPASDCTPNKSHPKCRRHKKSTGLSGPNSGDCRHVRPALRALLLATVGARVSSAAAVTEDGPGLRPGKLHGRAHQGREPNHPTRHMKRAFNRACRRANQSLQEGTWYRNRWHTRATLDALRSQPPPTISRVPRTARRHYRNSNRPDFSFRVLTWNAGGLSAALTQELMAWCDTCSATEQYDAIIITETHWKHVDDYRSGHWLCVHSTGHTEGEEVDRYAGILCLLSSKCFDAPRVKEHVKGRLLQVTATHIRSQMPTCFIGIYQHVWRPHLSAARNRALRSHIWQSLQSLITATPARHQLLVAGDFNATLTSMHHSCTHT